MLSFYLIMAALKLTNKKKVLHSFGIRLAAAQKDPGNLDILVERYDGIELHS